DAEFDSPEEAIAMSTMYAANHLKGVKAIIAMTESGRTARMMSRISSGLPIFAMSRHEKTLNQSSLYRGV
ncbi:pyruvate kinase alpha/beta domain-containing protein, partial [Klebsiella aerogenes]